MEKRPFHDGGFHSLASLRSKGIEVEGLDEITRDILLGLETRNRVREATRLSILIAAIRGSDEVLKDLFNDYLKLLSLPGVGDVKNEAERLRGVFDAMTKKD